MPSGRKRVLVVSNKNQYAIHILTDKSLDADQFARPFLEAWIDGNPNFTPERFGRGEPAQHPIADTGLEGLVSEWRKPPALMFKRMTAPKFVADVSWRETKGNDPRPYPWGIKVWLDRKAGDALALEFFEFLIQWFEPAFARMTSTEESTRKHFATYPFYEGGKHMGTAEQFVGTDGVDTLPGIYWLTYLTPKVIDERLTARLNDKVLRRDERGGVLIQAHEKSADIGSEMAQSMESEIINVLGRERFFDINRWMQERPETHRTP